MSLLLSAVPPPQPCTDNRGLSLKRRLLGAVLSIIFSTLVCLLPAASSLPLSSLVGQQPSAAFQDWDNTPTDSGRPSVGGERTEQTLSRIWQLALLFGSKDPDILRQEEKISNDMTTGFADASGSSSSGPTTSTLSESSSSSQSSSSPGGSTSGSAAAEEEEDIYPAADSTIQKTFIAIAYTNLVISFLASTVTSILVYLRRDKFPLYVLNVKALLLNEITIPFTVWAWSLSYVSPDAFCWFQLLFWATGLFPTVSFLLFSVVKLYLDHKVNTDKVDNPTSWACRLYPILRRPVVSIPLLVIIWVESWISIIPRAIRQLPYWGDAVWTDGCNQYTDFDNFADIVNYAIYTGLTVLSAIFLLRTVQEAFHLKPKLISACLTLCLTLQFYYVVLYTYDYFEDPKVWAIVQSISSLSCAIAMHLYTWLVPISILLDSYRYEQGEKRLNTVTAGQVKIFGVGASSSTALSRVSGPAQLWDVLYKEADQAFLDRFQTYLIKEFAVENMLYLRASMDLHRAQTEEQKQRLAKEIQQNYLQSGTPREINIADDLRRDLIKMVEEGHGAQTDLWEKIDREVCAMLVDSYNRFMRSSIVVPLSGAGAGAGEDKKGDHGLKRQCMSIVKTSRKDKQVTPS